MSQRIKALERPLKIGASVGNGGKSKAPLLISNAFCSFAIFSLTSLKTNLTF
jgi:hypothetical protein